MKALDSATARCDRKIRCSNDASEELYVRTQIDYGLMIWILDPAMRSERAPYILSLVVHGKQGMARLLYHGPMDRVRTS